MKNFGRNFFSAIQDKMATNTYHCQVLRQEGKRSQKVNICKQLSLNRRIKKKERKPSELFVMTQMNNFLWKLQPTLYSPMQSGDRPILRFTFPVSGPSQVLVSFCRRKHFNIFRFRSHSGRHFSLSCGKL